MNSNLKNEKQTLIRALITIFEKENLKAEQIANYISKLDKEVIEEILSTAVRNKKEVANEIVRAIKIIERRKIKDFQQSVEKGDYEDFLSHIPLEEQISMQKGLYGQSYSDILDFISKELKKRGFSTIEEWEEHNKRTVKSQEPIRDRGNEPKTFREEFDNKKNINFLSNQIVEYLNTNKIDHKKWFFIYQIFKMVLSSGKLDINKVSLLAEALLFAEVICVTDEEKQNIEIEKLRLSTLTKILNNPQEIKSRKITSYNIDKIYKEIDISDLTEPESKKRN